MIERHVHSLRCRLGKLGRRAPLQRQLQELAQRPGALVAIGIAILFIGSLFGGPLGSAFSRDSGTEEVATQSQPASSPAADERGVQESLAALSDRLERSGLDGMRLSTADGRILAEGELDPAALAKWRALRSWYDTTHGTRVLLVSAVRPGQGRAGPDLQIAAVWAGEMPYVLTIGGMRYFEGSILPDDWHVLRISRAAIELRRGNERHVIDLTGGTRTPALPKG